MYACLIIKNEECDDRRGKKNDDKISENVNMCVKCKSGLWYSMRRWRMNNIMNIDIMSFAINT